MDVAEKVSRQIYREFPLYKGVKPKKSGSTLIYEKKEKTEDGFEMKLTLRVTVDNEGNILQISGNR